MISEVSFIVEGKPVAWQRPGGKGVRYDRQVNDKVAFSMKALQAVQDGLAGREQEFAARPWFGTKALRVEIAFGFAEAKDMRQDLDNLVKFVLDAMQSQFLDGVVWKDDRQVEFLQAHKHVADKNYTAVKVSTLFNERL